MPALPEEPRVRVELTLSVWKTEVIAARPTRRAIIQSSVFGNSYLQPEKAT